MKTQCIVFVSMTGLLGFPLAAQDAPLEALSGVYEAVTEEGVATVDLMAAEDLVEGSLQLNERLYLIDCDAEDEEEADPDDESTALCAGVAYDMETEEMIYMELDRSGDQLLLNLYPDGDLNLPVRLVLEDAVAAYSRVDDASPEIDLHFAEKDDESIRMAAATDIDPAIVGVWVNSGSHSSGEITAAWENHMLLGSDGIMQLTEGRMAGGGSLGSFGDGGGDTLTVRWKVEGGIIWFAPANSEQWQPLGYYVYQEPSLLIQNPDGTRLLYRRIR